MDKSGIKSVGTAIVLGDEIYWANGYGEQPENNTMYGIASITKTFTATALLQLYEKGVFNLDDDVNKYLPFSLRSSFYPNVSITFRMLMSHKSGLARGSEDVGYFVHQNLVHEWLNESTSYPPLPEFMKELLTENGTYYSQSVFSKNKPGQTFGYSNIGFTVLGYLIELLSNKSIDVYLHDYIFLPLNMSNSGYNHSKYKSQVAIPYVYDLDAGFNGTEEENIQLPVYSTIPVGSTGILTSTLDLSKYLIVHMNRGEYKGVRILKEETVNLMHSSMFGWGVLPSGFGGHNGHTQGYMSEMGFDEGTISKPALGTIVFVNKGGEGVTVFRTKISDALRRVGMNLFTSSTIISTITQDRTTLSSTGIINILSLGIIVIFYRKTTRYK